MDTLNLTCSCGKTVFSWNSNTGTGMCIDCIKWLDSISQRYVLDGPDPKEKSDSLIPVWVAFVVPALITCFILSASLKFFTI